MISRKRPAGAEPPDVSDENKAELRRRRDLYNPVVIKNAMDRARDSLLQLNREKDGMYSPSGRGAEASL
jgi:hypothetical protein